MQQLANKWDTELYNDKHSFVHEYGSSLIDLLDPKQGERILDLGCGTGQLTAKIKEFTDHVIGMDWSPEMIESARFNYPLVEFIIGDAANFEFGQKFDSIFSNATLHWVTEYEKAIDSIHNNLGKGGKLVAEFGGKGNIEAIVEAISNALMESGYRRQSNLKLWYFPSIAEYASALEKKGFKVTFAQLYDRPTELADEETGIKDWLGMFAGAYFEGVEQDEVAQIKQNVQERLRPTLFRNGKWFADYKRIRVVAYK